MAGIWNPVFLMFALLLYVSMQGVNGRPHNIGSLTGGNTNDKLNIKGALVALQTTSATIRQLLQILTELLGCVNDEDIQNKASDLPAKVGQLLSCVDDMSKNFKRAATMDLAELQINVMIRIQEEIIPTLGKISIELSVMVNIGISLGSREGSGNVKTGLVKDIASKLSGLRSLLDRVNPQLKDLNKRVATMLAGGKAAGGGDSVTKVLAQVSASLNSLSAQLSGITTRVTDLVDNLVKTGNAELGQILKSLNILKLVPGLMKTVTGVIGGDLLGLPLLDKTLKSLTVALEGASPMVCGVVKGVVEMVPTIFDSLHGLVGGKLLKTQMVKGILNSVKGLLCVLEEVLDGVLTVVDGVSGGVLTVVDGVLGEVLPSVTGLANALPGGVLGA